MNDKHEFPMIADLLLEEIGAELPIAENIKDLNSTFAKMISCPEIFNKIDTLEDIEGKDNTNEKQKVH